MPNHFYQEYTTRARLTLARQFHGVWNEIAEIGNPFIGELKITMGVFD
jgi:hypothetical protein